MDEKTKFKNVLLSDPHTILGKKGLHNNKGFINHVNQLLKTHKIIKIKILKTALHDMKIDELAHHIAQKTESYLLDLRGRTIILSSKLIEIK